jgi:xyloglucan-specific endo-beta-1,4-glucanase
MRRKTSLLVTALTTAALTAVPALPAQAATNCTAFGTITLNKYYVNNNLWGQGSGTGSQCVSDTRNGATIGWNTTFNWANQPSQVKSYDSSVLGWHWGWKTQGTELPVRLNAGRDIYTDFSYRVGATGTFNVAYDLWLHNIANPDWPDNPTDEVMIWTYRAGGAGPLGTLQGTVTIAGTSWDLYRGNIGWNVFSFVRRANTTSGVLHLQDFLNNLVGRGWVANTKYLSSIEHGTEVFVGSGRLDVDSYTADIR